MSWKNTTIDLIITDGDGDVDIDIDGDYSGSGDDDCDPVSAHLRTFAHTHEAP